MDGQAARIGEVERVDEITFDAAIGEEASRTAQMEGGIGGEGFVLANH
jgi:hypothetical protein